MLSLGVEVEERLLVLVGADVEVAVVQCNPVGLGVGDVPALGEVVLLLLLVCVANGLRVGKVQALGKVVLVRLLVLDGSAGAGVAVAQCDAKAELVSEALSVGEAQALGEELTLPV